MLTVSIVPDTPGVYHAWVITQPRARSDGLYV